MRLTLVRHGETEENVQGILQGHLPGHLTDKGRQQAQEIAKKLRGRPFDAIYCSDLQRCLDTAEPIRRVFPEVPFVTTQALRERKGGVAEGKVVDSAYWESLPGNEYSGRFLGGESWEDVRERMKRLLNELYSELSSAYILLIMHGGPIRGIRSLLERKSLPTVYAEGTSNTGIWEETMTELLE